MIREFFDVQQWFAWLASLDRHFVFLLALPFVVMVVGLWSWWAEKDQSVASGEAPASPEGAPARERRVRERRRNPAGRVPQQEG